MIPRDLALKTLSSPESSPGSAERTLNRSFERYTGLSERDRAFTLHLVQGVLRWRLRLDWIVRQTLNFPFEKIEPSTLDILRIALYQIFFMDRVPDSAAVNEAVRQAKGLGRRHVAGFVNGILRNICRNRDRIPFPHRGGDETAYLSVCYSYPEWWVRKWTREMGAEQAERLLDAGNRIPGMVLRVNGLRTDRPGLIRRLEDEGMKVAPAPYSPQGVGVLEGGGAVDGSKAFQEGLFQVQGEAAQVCSELLNPAPGDRVLDLCAGLGGKSTHMAELMKDRGLVLALDRSLYRLVRLGQSARRLGARCILAVAADATRPSPVRKGISFDRIIVDSPCSGLGVVSRHPDGKWARGEEDIGRLASLQKEILDRSVSLLRKGGRMLFAVCTLSRDENEDVVEHVLRGHPEMALCDLKKDAPEWALDLIDENGFFRALPHVHGMDGFFGALFEKNRD